MLVLDFGLRGDTGESFRCALRSSGFPFEVLERVVSRGELAISLRDDTVDIIVLVGPVAALIEQAGDFDTRTDARRIPLFAVTDNQEADSLFQLLQSGFDDFATPPFSSSEVVPRIRRMVCRQKEQDVQLHLKKKEFGLKRFIGTSPLLLSEINKIPLLAQCDVSILISGETGTGKELCARALHYLSPRSGGPFIPVNCGAIPMELAENELFGHERGAFTGANASRVGVIEEAEGGTILLDEADCLPSAVQVKLLRFLQEKEYRRLGSTRTRNADVRILAAMNSDAREAMESGKLRQDLYYRLNVVPLVLPPLRHRKEDIPLLARYFLNKFARDFRRNVSDISPEALEQLTTYEWPGNVREMEHTIQRAVIFSQETVLQASSLSLPTTVSSPAASFKQAKADVIASFESNYIRQLLEAHGGNITRAASAARKNRRAFWQLIRKHNIDVTHFCPQPRQR